VVGLNIEIRLGRERYTSTKDGEGNRTELGKTNVEFVDGILSDVA
jgi:hypothetical protein